MPETTPPLGGHPIESGPHALPGSSRALHLADLAGFEEARHIVDFCSIANPYYPTPAMVQHLQDELPALIRSYPSSDPRRSEECLAAVLHVDPDHLVIGSGASSIIAALCEMLVGNLGIPVPAFSGYGEKLRSTGAAGCFRLNPRREYHLDPVEFAEWLRRNGLRAALVANPGNPTGQLIPLAEMLWLLGATRNLEMVIVDESFIDFAGQDIPTLLPHVEEFANLIVLRSMSAHRGAPGLRLGYACTADPGQLARMRQAVPTWSLGTLAREYLSLLPATDDDYHAGRLRLIDDVRAFRHDLAAIPGFHAYPTGANFMLVHIDLPLTAGELQMRLLQEWRLYVPALTSKDGLDDRHVRIASQGREKDLLLLEALRAISRRYGK